MDDNSVVLEDWLPGTSNYTIRAWTLTGVAIVYTIFPNIDNSDNVLQFPAELFGKLKSLYWNYVDPGSYTSVNASPQAVRRIANTMSFKSYPITILDELKNEVLFMLYSDVYTRFIQKLGT
ncbi:hypothetical protein H4R24_004675 [Coemansia sp. RSA 988]|nr:hypothetical protein H4R24_004675 [Coemansia sp. RSA 988]